MPVTERSEMLRLAEENHWSVRRLKSEVTERRRNGGERRGRPRQTRGMQVESVLRQCATRLANAVDELTAKHVPQPMRNELWPLVLEIGKQHELLTGVLAPERRSKVHCVQSIGDAAGLECVGKAG